MDKYKQINVFKINMAYWKFLGMWPGDRLRELYKYYSKIFILIFVIMYITLLTINFLFIPRRLDFFIDELVFFFTELAMASKVLTVYFMHDNIQCIFDTLESDMFQPQSENGLKILNKAKKFIKKYYLIVAIISYLSNLTHVLSPLIVHIIFSIDLMLPVCSYSFLSENLRQRFVYPLYLYQSVGIHFHMLVNVNTDSIILGVMIMTIAQLEVLHYNLTTFTDNDKHKENHENGPEKELIFKKRLHKCIVHFVEIDKFCSLFEKVFSITLFVQFSASSCIVCVILYRFTMPAPTSYLVFLITYMAAMLVQILMPTWFGTRIMETSSSLSTAIYNCDWISRPQSFKSSLILFVERMNRPLAITALKMFPLLLTTFTKIMNTAYSFYTLLRNIQNPEP